MTDPFTSTSNIVKRLHKEYKKHPKLIIAVDFDDTVYDFHKRGALHERAINVVKQCAALGFYVVLWTASAPERFDFMRTYMKDNGIHVDAINENPIKLPFGNNGKIYYNILLDDRAGLGQALDALEIFLDNIQNSREPEAMAPQPEKPDMNNPIAVQIQTLNCSQLLNAAGFASPRTCTTCGLGPCKYPIC
jgi:hydroxymethylpyrimidine pyrophosphatase-like HAD family hydrolase